MAKRTQKRIRPLQKETPTRKKKKTFNRNDRGRKLPRKRTPTNTSLANGKKKTWLYCISPSFGEKRYGLKDRRGCDKSPIDSGTWCTLSGILAKKRRVCTLTHALSISSLAFVYSGHPDLRGVKSVPYVSYGNLKVKTLAKACNSSLVLVMRCS